MTKKISLLLLTYFYTTMSYAFGCGDVSYSMRLSTDAAKSLHYISGGSLPLTEEVSSLSSKANTFAVVLSFSGMQKTYEVVIEPQLCQVKSVEQVD